MPISVAVVAVQGRVVGIEAANQKCVDVMREEVA